jgi:uncharacterized membrane protein
VVKSCVVELWSLSRWESYFARQALGAAVAAAKGLPAIIARIHEMRAILSGCFRIPLWNNPNVPTTAVSTKRPVFFAIFLMAVGVIGWFASFDLTIEKIETLVNPGYAPSCDISPLVACGPNMASWQGSVFGFPNPIIGVAAFMAPIFVGAAILAGARFAKWFWVLFNLGMLGAFVFVWWLISQSIFVLGTLCPYCMLVWSVVIPGFFYVTVFNLKNGAFGNGAASRRLFARLFPWTWVLAILGYILVIVMAQLRLDAITTILLYS